MALLVQKFGGTSLADVERLRACAARAVNAHLDGHRVVVVVSAMGHATDELLDLAALVSDDAPPRELDALLATGEQASAALMAMAVHALGVPAASCTARQLGIATDSVHGNARIRTIDAGRIVAELERGRVVVAPGFLGTSVDGELTTLGRGGSDTTAVALAAALGVRDGRGACEIYTDVHGVHTADPRIVPGAVTLARVTYEEMVELASLGAGVLHTRAVMLGKRYGVPIHVRHSARRDEGTLIVNETPEMERGDVVGCALTRDLGRVAVRGLPNRPGTLAAVFAHVERGGILVDDIMQIEAGDCVDVAFTVEAPRLADLKLAARAALDEIGSGEMSVEVGLAKISAVGVGMRTHTGVAAAMFRALADAGINIANVTTSEIKISCLVPREHAERGLRVVHDAFGLGRRAEEKVPVPEPK